MPSPMKKANNAYADTVRAYQERAETALARRLPAATIVPAHLHEAMRYAVLGGGKRIRPVFVYATGVALGAQLEALDAPACAIELIHGYSLVHDDLPAMDDDDLRRGRPTVHKAFDEATAILAGDALQALAFEVLAKHDSTIAAPARLAMISVLAAASGSQGMAGGQAIDLAAVGRPLSLTELEAMHGYKTGALIRASVAMAALAAGADDSVRGRLDCYARCVGLAFQVRDDILDIEGDTAVLGKPQGSDIAKHKPTYPALLGMTGAKRVARELHAEAVASLAPLGGDAGMLRHLADYVVDRIT